MPSSASSTGDSITFVLVHGAYHGAWCWYRTAPILEERGHTVVTLDLPAHGVDTTPVSEVTLEGYVDRVCAVLDEQSGPVALVGHSMGGLTISQAAERRPDAVDTLVYLTAFLLPDGETLIDQRSDESLIPPNFVTDEERGVGYVVDDALKAVFYADCRPADVTLARSLLRPEPLAPMTTLLDLSPERFGSVPRAYIECTDDRAIPLTQQREFRSRLACETTVTLETSHSPFFAAPEETANALSSVKVP
jgi:pimeloyl-ACP methyl ester carboxylesterase